MTSVALYPTQGRVTALSDIQDLLSQFEIPQDTVALSWVVKQIQLNNCSE